ncbi:hypothetical protein MTO96_024394 [Rhipicephalus appendiculatus]
MGEASEVSTAADSSTAVAGGAAAGGGSGKTILVVVGLLALLGVIGVIAYLAASPKAANKTKPTEAPTLPTPPAPPTPETPAWPTPMSPPGPFSVSTLICTVNGQAIYPNMLPEEDLCTILVFCHVTIRNKGIYGTDNKLSFETFKEEMSKRNKTAGMSFDIRYSDSAALTADVDKVMQELAENKIGHYGVLNVLDSSPNLKHKYEKAKDLLATLKHKYINDAWRRTIMAFGVLNFLGVNAKSIFEELFKEAIDKEVADIVIPLSIVSSIEREADCHTFPPGVWDLKTLTAPASEKAGYLTDLKTIAGMMDKTNTYNTSSQMGFAIELGTLGYLLQAEPPITATGPALVNAKCDRFFLTSMDAMPCKIDHVKKKVFPDVNAQKLKDPSTNLRDNMAVLLTDVNLGYFMKGCILTKDDPFHRISVAKAEFGVK